MKFLSERVNKNIFLIPVFVLLLNIQTVSQVKENNGFWKWTSWTLIQTIPSPGWYQDADEFNSSMKFGLEWQVIPLSYGFNVNKYVSPIQSFYINPVKRFAGSAELYFNPVFIPGGFKYFDAEKFMIRTGGRFIIPAAQMGEYLSFSLGGGVNYSSTKDGKDSYDPSIEAAAYSFFGMIGLKYNYNFNSFSKHSFGIYFKYY